MISDDQIKAAYELLDRINHERWVRLGYDGADANDHQMKDVIAALEVLASYTTNDVTNRVMEKQIEVMDSAKQNARAYVAYVDEMRGRLAMVEKEGKSIS